jgi:lipoprotein-anchoring transpeptidase ErfK/SrfK
MISMRRLFSSDIDPLAVRLDRRSFSLAALALLASPTLALAEGKKRAIEIDARFLPQLVSSPYPEDAGTIVVVPQDRYLYLIEDDGFARRYGVGVGRAGLAFSGSATVGRKAKWPSWRPTDNMIRRNPKKYARYAGGVPGGPKNPLGSRALYLFRDGRDTLYRIHGTTEPWTIGKAVSNGCIRMVNDHVEDLYERVPVGARVVVIA